MLGFVTQQRMPLPEIAGWAKVDGPRQASSSREKLLSSIQSGFVSFVDSSLGESTFGGVCLGRISATRRTPSGPKRAPSTMPSMVGRPT